MSIGAAVSHEPVTAIDGLIARTDAALYRAKHAGRNTVHIADEEIANDRSRMIAAARRARQMSTGAPSAYRSAIPLPEEVGVWRPAGRDRNLSFTVSALPCAHVAFSNSSRSALA